MYEISNMVEPIQCAICGEMMEKSRPCPICGWIYVEIDDDDSLWGQYERRMMTYKCEDEES